MGEALGIGLGAAVVGGSLGIGLGAALTGFGVGGWVGFRVGGSVGAAVVGRGAMVGAQVVGWKWTAGEDEQLPRQLEDVRSVFARLTETVGECVSTQSPCLTQASFQRLPPGR